MHEIIKLKSTQENYRKEYLGIKNNTLRKKDMSDKRFILLSEFENGNINNLVIQITNTKTKETFNKIISDVTTYEDWVIISWRD